MQAYVAITYEGDGSAPFVVAGSDDLQDVRKAAEDYVQKNPTKTVSVFNKTGSVGIVCAPKWQ